MTPQPSPPEPTIPAPPAAEPPATDHTVAADEPPTTQAWPAGEPPSTGAGAADEPGTAPEAVPTGDEAPPSAAPPRVPRSHRRRRARRRRRVVGAVAGFLGQGWELRGVIDAAESARPLSADEAARLADMRWHNWQDRYAGLRATISGPSGDVHLVGWLDWQHPVVYLARTDPASDARMELLQAVPGLVAHRPARPGPTATPPPATNPPATNPPPAAVPARAAPAAAGPPHAPPADGWRLRVPGLTGPAGAADDPATVDSLLVLLLSLAASEPDSAPALAGSDAQWLRRDQLADTELDVLLGPAVLPTTDPGGEAIALAAMGGAVQYWLDAGGRLHRLQALLTEQTTVKVDLDRGDRTAPPVLAVLGGAAIDPRPVTEAEVQTLAQLRVRNLHAGGGEVRLTLPGEHGSRLRATGWLDWQRPVAYLATYRDGAPDGLLWADSQGVSTRGDHPPQRGLPPLPAPPPDGGWHWQPWSERGDPHGGYDLDLLVLEALALSSWYPDDPAVITEQALWLREDTLDGAAVGVYELRQPAEAELPPGEARLRYWVDGETGVLLRLEIRARSGGFGQLDITPGPLPYLG
jgi:hypothetical protein